MNDSEREFIKKNLQEIINLYKQIFAITNNSEDKATISRCEKKLEELKGKS